MGKGVGFLVDGTGVGFLLGVLVGGAVTGLAEVGGLVCCEVGFLLGDLVGGAVTGLAVVGVTGAVTSYLFKEQVSDWMKLTADPSNPFSGCSHFPHTLSFQRRLSA